MAAGVVSCGLISMRYSIDILTVATIESHITAETEPSRSHTSLSESLG